MEFDTFRKQAELNSFNLTPKKWIEATDAIGVISKSGRYGGTINCECTIVDCFQIVSL